MCVVTARACVLWPHPDIYCNYYVRAKFKPGGAPGCYDARGNTACMKKNFFKQTKSRDAAVKKNRYKRSRDK